MLIVQFDGPPSWSLDTNENGERTKCPWVRVVGLIAWGEVATAVPSTTPTHGHFLSTSGIARKNRGL